jgi:hypothetical protein
MFGLDDAISAGLKILDKFVPDPAARAQAEAALRQSLQQWDAQQNKINEVEAQSSSLFVAGWRPLIGWICGASLAWQFVVMPMGLWSAAVFGVNLPTPPSLDGMLWELMFAMLGMGGLRTFEKIKGVAAK